MDPASQIELGIISSVIRLGDVCLSCPLNVGQCKRPAPHRVNRTRTILPAALGVVFVAGVLGFGGAVAWQATASREGNLSGEGLFTLRQPGNLQVASLAEQGEVTKNAVLSRFLSPEREAELAALDLRCQCLKAEEKVLAEDSLTIAPDITQRVIELGWQKRAIDQSLSCISLERQHLFREMLRDRLTREDSIGGLRTQIDKTQKELAQVRTVLALATENYQRALALGPRGAIAGTEYSEKVSEFKSRQIEAGKLEEQLGNLGRQKADLEQARADAIAVSDRHEQSLSADKTTLEAQRKEVNAGLAILDAERSKEQARASRHRSESLRKLRVEMDQVARQRSVLERSLQFQAPFDGRVVYRASSPGSVVPGQPLLVLAPSGGLRFRAHLPRWTKASLEQAGNVLAELSESRTSNEAPRPLNRRFTATLAAWTDEPDLPGCGLAEFRCDLPPDAVPLLAAGNPVAARLVWRPAFHTVPLFAPSVALTCFAGLALALCRRSTSRASIARNPEGTGVEFTTGAIPVKTKPEDLGIPINNREVVILTESFSAAYVN